MCRLVINSPIFVATCHMARDLSSLYQRGGGGGLGGKGGVGGGVPFFMKKRGLRKIERVKWRKRAEYGGLLVQKNSL